LLWLSVSAVPLAVLLSLRVTLEVCGWVEIVATQRVETSAPLGAVPALMQCTTVYVHATAVYSVGLAIVLLARRFEWLDAGWYCDQLWEDQ
jgi:hypothetical protein